MVFSSLSFLFLFLPVFALIYFLTPSGLLKNIVLVASSFIFYGWGNPVWVLFLLSSAVVDYGNGLWIEHFRDSRLKIVGLLSTLVFNLGLLVLFKYPKFLTDIVNGLLRTHFVGMEPALPAGMSFYTFETISYTVDVYRGKSRAQRSLLNFLVFIASFPRLVAGPIVRYWQVEHELASRTVRLADISVGVTRFCRGLFKKVFFANVAGALTARYLDGQLSDLTVCGAWFGLLMYTLQIYFDFSGYSDMAIGLGRMIGFELPENFRHPYIADSITDFWRRWHITMSNFFRDYVYIPLGGNRYGELMQVRNIALVWAATGLWHGASWNFVFWGLYFGVLVLLEKWFVLRVLGHVPRILRHLYALLFIILGWLIFHITDLGRLADTARLMAGGTDAPVSDYDLLQSVEANAFWIVAAVILCTPVRTWAAALLHDRVPPAIARSGEALLNLFFLLASITLLVGSSYNPFIYFRF
jgi:alginate O-acetyltransferase complex protein AlgI